MHPLWPDIARSAGLELSAGQLGQLDLYLEKLIDKNQQLNLTRIISLEDAQVKHVADALTLLKYLPPLPDGQAKFAGKSVPAKSRKWTLADLGTGGGIPGVILAIARPDISVTLVDSTSKKLTAVQEICVELELTNVQTLHGRIEKIDQTYDIITARAVAELDTLLQWSANLMKPTSRLLAMKGPKVEKELVEAKKTLSRLHLKANVEPVDHPALAGHVIVRIARG